ncbi:MAG: type II toxin-antitoxin system VapC family toxin [Candidatus Melainabacteria bacterium]|nr:type II toxin-antitoxin system VapC family toxin [Candidatus Melainabacteria bacterium]
MKYLLDTHLLVWALSSAKRLSQATQSIIADAENEMFFSAASIWEISIKSSAGRQDFQVDPAIFRRGLLDNDYRELPITGEHAATVVILPPIHKDPFDRLLIAQAIVEGITFLTVDAALTGYPGPILKV